MLRFDLRVPDWGPATVVEQYAAALDMAEWADQHGVDTLVFSEHHGSEDGYLPSPVVLAAACAGRTSRIGLMISALLVPLHDPVQMAEDLTVLQLVSGGRLAVTAGAGYRPEESAMFGVDFDARGQAVEDHLRVLLDAWAGEEVTSGEWTGRITPAPQAPPFLMVGGSSKAAARRAATLGVPFQPADHVPDLAEHYERICEERGTAGFVLQPPPGGPLTLYLADDPDRAWAQLGPHLLHDVQAYGAWQPTNPRNAMHREVSTVDELRAADLFTIASPEDGVALAREADVVLLHPLCGGIPADLGWETLGHWEETVAPALAPAAAAGDGAS
jgi:alkanesulfonate monooxygenase SsuD/methylene tetrahydromethanopterin reductase-like flavin-dependent oxidoreductase (luciferase family)